MAARAFIDVNEAVKAMKKKSGKAFILTGIIFFAVGLLVNIRVIRGIIIMLISDEPKSIGIIGGADAPTAIFISSRIFRDMSILEKAGLLLIIAVPFLITIGIVKYRRAHKGIKK